MTARARGLHERPGQEALLKELLDKRQEESSKASAEEPGCAVLDAGKELKLLRAEMERTRGIFDSARLVVGHELNRPLTSIHGYIELIEARFEDLSSEKEKGYFSKVKEAVAEMEGLIESFIHMLRFDNPGEAAEDFDEISVHQLVAGICNKYKDGGEGVENRVDPEMPLVLIRKSCLEIVIDNLVSNAVKHGASSRAARVEAEIRPDRRGMSGRKLLLLRVTDHGAGIPEKELGEIFDPFYRGDSENRGTEGLGLGLALVRNVINIMMGSINVDSGTGKGTVATVCIPIPEEKLGPYDRIG